MSKSCKRSSFVWFFVAVCFIIITYSQDRLLPRGRVSVSPAAASHQCPAIPPSKPYVKPKSDRFDWRAVPVKNPVSSLSSLPTTSPTPLPRIQHVFADDTLDATTKDRQNAIRETFQRAWKSYHDKAWMKDELSPVSGGFRNRYGGWAATLVDSLDTLWIMDMKPEYEEAVKAAMTINFSPDTLSQDTISTFETNIRWLGGFLGAYDLTKCKDKRLLDKAVEVGDMLYASFDFPNHAPLGTWDVRKAAAGEEQHAVEDGIFAQFGSMSLEFTRLSQLTGDMRYFDAIQRLTNILDQQQNKTRLPGLWPQKYKPDTLDFTVDNSFTLGANADSAYEYLPKMYALLAGSEPAPQYARMHATAMDAATKHIFYRPMTPDNTDVLLAGKATASDSGISTDSESEHLTFFLGGMLLLSSRLFANASHEDIGLRLARGAAWTYRASPSGVSGENFHTVACAPGPCEWNETLWSSIAVPGTAKGFTRFGDGRYMLRPEAVESIFYAWRVTGDAAWREVAWTMWEAIDEHTRTEWANAALQNAFQSNQPAKADDMESFWMAETLKYFYLIFSDPGLVSLDEFVLNTEAHPFRVPK
ncbi:alpha-mannosidase [Trichodelitschia bisporula]|uniref:alpha-1,2-Mannosidase n=1 Tax=Trichodelitschia bisporula TaxID=703511 RepID=A0A6G1IAP9_9PEZI|nr:alpha-mannosidase [Trichodelitschia bisporula]